MAILESVHGYHHYHILHSMFIAINKMLMLRDVLFHVHVSFEFHMV